MLDCLSTRPEDVAAEHAYLLSVVQQLVLTAQEAVDYFAGRKGPPKVSMPLGWARSLLRDLDSQRILSMKGSILDVVEQVHHVQRDAQKARLSLVLDLIDSMFDRISEDKIIYSNKQRQYTSREIRTEVRQMSELGIEFLRSVLENSSEFHE